MVDGEKADATALRKILQSEQWITSKGLKAVGMFKWKGGKNDENCTNLRVALLVCCNKKPATENNYTAVVTIEIVMRV